MFNLKTSKNTFEDTFREMNQTHEISPFLYKQWIALQASHQSLLKNLSQMEADSVVLSIPAVEKQSHKHEQSFTDDFGNPTVTTKPVVTNNNEKKTVEELHTPNIFDLFDEKQLEEKEEKHEDTSHTTRSTLSEADVDPIFQLFEKVAQASNDTPMFSFKTKTNPETAEDYF
ncbi:MAG: hypothetical protein ACRCWQ_00540 [Bacilli bacterium]